MNLLGLRCVLDDLDQIVAEHDLAVGRGHVLAEGERVAIHLEWNSLAMHQIIHRELRAAEQARATGVERAHQDARIDQEIRWCERIEHQVRELAGLGVGHGIALACVDEIIDVLAGGEVALQQREVGRILFPCGVGEASVLGIRRNRSLGVVRIPHAGCCGRDVRKTMCILCGRLGHRTRVLHRTPRDGGSGRPPPDGVERR